jgi:hypothetical protein
MWGQPPRLSSQAQRDAPAIAATPNSPETQKAQPVGYAFLVDFSILQLYYITSLYSKLHNIRCKSKFIFPLLTAT